MRESFRKVFSWLGKLLYDLTSWTMVMALIVAILIPLIIICAAVWIARLFSRLAKSLYHRSAPARSAIGRWVGKSLRQAILFAVPTVARLRAWLGRQFIFNCLLVGLVPLWLIGLVSVVVLTLLNTITPALGLTFSLIFASLLCAGWRGSAKTQEKVNDREMARKRRIALETVDTELVKLKETLQTIGDEGIFKNVLVHTPAVFADLLRIGDETTDFSAEEIETVTAHFAKNAEAVATGVVVSKTANYFNDLKTGIGREWNILDLAAKVSNFYKTWLRAAQVEENLAEEETNRLYRLLTDANPDWMVVPAGVTLRVGHGQKPDFEKIRAMFARFASVISARGHDPEDCGHCDIILDCPFLDELLALEQQQ